LPGAVRFDIDAIADPAIDLPHMCVPRNVGIAPMRAVRAIYIVWL
jgi:hypothetical protein